MTNSTKGRENRNITPLLHLKFHLKILKILRVTWLSIDIVVGSVVVLLLIV